MIITIANIIHRKRPVKKSKRQSANSSPPNAIGNPGNTGRMHPAMPAKSNNADIIKISMSIFECVKLEQS